MHEHHWPHVNKHAFHAQNSIFGTRVAHKCAPAQSRTRRTCRLDPKTPRSETKPHPGHMRELWWRPRSDPRKDHVQDAAGSEKRAGGDRHRQQRDARGNRRELRQHDKTQGGWDSRHLDGTRRVGGHDAALYRHHRQCGDCVVYEGRFRFCSHKKRHSHDYPGHSRRAHGRIQQDLRGWYESRSLA